MEDYLIDFKNMDWESPVPSVRYKVYIRNNHKIRLVEFTDEFVEEDWCTKEHIGYVIEGSISVDFNGKLINFREGDGFFISDREENKHKAKIAKGKKALIILFEKN